MLVKATFRNILERLRMAVTMKESVLVMKDYDATFNEDLEVERLRVGISILGFIPMETGFTWRCCFTVRSFVYNLSYGS